MISARVLADDSITTAPGDVPLGDAFSHPLGHVTLEEASDHPPECIPTSESTHCMTLQQQSQVDYCRLANLDCTQWEFCAPSLVNSALSSLEWRAVMEDEL